ncbi:MAG: sugar ABC transporter substrate-binding protein [Spirochaetes bacterium]|nr:sugar ABC transporter substrate-binding protein [Spirochaetota bacterium]
MFTAAIVFAAQEKSEKPATGEKKLPDEIVIGWTPPDIQNVFATATEYFEKTAADAKKAGINVKIVTHSPASHTDFGGQVAIIEDFIANKVDCIVISPAEIEVIKPAVKSANRAGIPVIIVNLLDPIEGLEVASYIGFSNIDAAAVAGYTLIDYLGGPGVLGKGKMLPNPPEYLDLAFWKDLYKDVNPKDLNIKADIAIIEGVCGGFFSTRRLQGFHSVIDQYPGIKVLTTLPADWNREKAVNVMEDILQTYNHIDAVYAACNIMAIGAVRVIEAAGRANEMVMVTQDGTEESVDMIREGRILSETWHGFPEWGWYGGRFAVMAALGLKVPSKFDVRPRTEYIGNADNFYPNVKLEPHPWDKIIKDYLSK